MALHTNLVKKKSTFRQNNVPIRRFTFQCTSAFHFEDDNCIVRRITLWKLLFRLSDNPCFNSQALLRRI